MYVVPYYTLSCCYVRTYVALLLDTRAISLSLPLHSSFVPPPFPSPPSLPLLHSLMFDHRPQSWRELALKMADFGVLHLNELVVDRKKVCTHALLPNSSMIVMYKEDMIKMMGG